jgi:hypothetical protein
MGWSTPHSKKEMRPDVKKMDKVACGRRSGADATTRQHCEKNRHGNHAADQQHSSDK